MWHSDCDEWLVILMGLLRFQVFGITQIIYMVLAVLGFGIVVGFFSNTERKKCSLEVRLYKSFFTTA